MSEKRRSSLHRQLGLPLDLTDSLLLFERPNGTAITLRPIGSSVLEYVRSDQLRIETEVVAPLSEFTGKATLKFLTEHCQWNLGIKPVNYPGSILLDSGKVVAIPNTPDPQ